MRFLLRLAFWFAVIAILLPEGGSQPPSRVQLSAGAAIAAARGTVGDMRQFCERQPEACAVGSQAAQVLGERATGGAKQIYDFLNHKSPPGESAADRARRATMIPLPPPRPSQHTLTPADLAPAWLDPRAAQGCASAHGGDLMANSIEPCRRIDPAASPAGAGGSPARLASPNDP